MPDDRRSLTIRLSVLQYLVAVLFAALAVGFWIFQIAQHQKFLETAENNRLRRLPLPAPRGVLLDRDGKVLVENQNTMNIALVREQTKNLGDVLHVLAGATNVNEAQLKDTVNRRRREAGLPADRPDRERQPRAGDRGVGAAPRAARDHLPGSAVAPLPGQRHGRAPVRVRQRGDRQPAPAPGVRRRRARHHGRAGRRRARLQQEPDGAGRGQAGRRQQRRPRDPRAGQDRSDRRPPAAADHRLRRPEIDRGRLRRERLQRRRGGGRSARRRRARLHQPSRLRSQRLRGRHRSRDLGVAQQRQPQAAVRTARSRASTRPGPPSRWRSASPASKKG